MRLRVLGCHGGEALHFNATSFLINDDLLVDAGSVASRLSVDAQARIDYVLITHPHLDHVKDLCFLADNVYGKRERPVQIIGPPAVLEDLRRHLFNWVLWPDFSELPSRERPTVAFVPIEARLECGRYTFECREVNHPGNAVGYVIEDRASDASIVVSGDTRETEALWTAGFAHANLKAVFADVSFPDELEHLARAAGHFTPASFVAEAAKFPRDGVPVYLYHLKPAYHHEVIAAVAALGRAHFKVIEQGDDIDFTAP